MSSWRVVAAAVAVTALGALPTWLLSALAPEIGRVAGLDSASLGIVIGAFFGASSLFGIVAARVVDDIGWRLGMIVSAACCAAACTLMAIVASPWIGMVAIVVFGAFANSACQPASNLAVATAVHSSRQGVAMGTKQAALPVATFFVGVSVPLFAGPGGWRIAFGVAAVIAVGVVTTLVPFRSGLTAREVAARIVGVGRAFAGARGRRTRSDDRALRTLAAGAGFGTAATMCLGGFLVIYAVATGRTHAEGGILLAIGSGVGILARIGSGVLADRRRGRHFVVVAVMMLAGVAGIVVLALGEGMPMLVVGTALAYGLGWSWNGVFHYAVVRSIPGSAARATGVVQVAMSFGAMFGPVTFGVVAQWSFTIAWSVCAVELLVGALLVVVGRRMLRPR